MRTFIGPSAPHLTLFTICLLLLLYGYEIFNFSLSIDEESFSHKNAFRASITEGRWAVGVLTRVFPPLGNVPMISTVLFCAGLGLTACVLARVLFRDHSAQLAFVGVFVSSPLWPHIAEFNQVSWGVGIGCVLLALSLLLTLAESRFSGIFAAAFLAAATGIYQSLYLGFFVLLFIRHLSVLLGLAPADVTNGTRQRFPWLRSGLISVGGLLGYLAVERLLLVAFSLKLTYVQGFIRLAEFTTAPVKAFGRTLLRGWNLLSGADPIYLGYGYVVTLVSLLGLLIVVILLLRRRPLTISQRLLGGAILVATLATGMGPILVSAGTVPARSVFSWVPVSAFMAGVTLSNSGRFKKLMYVALAAALFVSMWISVSLFYTDHIARQRDELLAARIMARVDNILPNPSGRIPFVVIGAPPADDAGPFRKVEIFGDSFFDRRHEGGNPFRVAAYLRILGVDTLEPHLMTDVAPLRPVIEAMPVWPAAGSVAVINGMLVIKLGPLPPA